jgi:YebC/PmpR family DNA-binding regulatory protein
MSGHSKWATIKRSKAANDSKRGAVFTKIGREILIAVREAGPDPEGNFRLRLILDKARRSNMPKENVERAIKRGSGEGGDGIELAECVYEGYGPSGTAIMVQALTDNRNRTVSEVRHIFTRHGGNMGSDGCVAWMFQRKGQITVKPGDNDPEEVGLVAIDAGADDVEIGEESVEIYTEMTGFRSIQEALHTAGYEIEDAQLVWAPQSNMTLAEKDTLKTMKLLEALEEIEDVQQVFSNLDIQDEMVAKFESEAA